MLCLVGFEYHNFLNAGGYILYKIAGFYVNSHGSVAIAMGWTAGFQFLAGT
jgi:hypothetical protein